MKMSINARGFVEELMKNEYLIINYSERKDGGFILSVSINEELLQEGMEAPKHYE